YMLYSDTEAELYQAKANIEANRSFTYQTTYSRPSTATFTFNNNTLNRMSTTQSQFPSQSQNKYLYPSATISENRKILSKLLLLLLLQTQILNLFQLVFITPSSSFSLNNTSYVSAPNSPISTDSSDTFVVNDIKISSSNPFRNDINTNTNTNTNNNNNTTNLNRSKATNNEIKNCLTISTDNMDPAMVVTPITPESDSEENVRGHKRSGKKSKRNSKKLASPLLTLKTTELNKDISKNSYNKFSPESASVIAYKANMRMNSPMEEDDDVPLGIIQYKCLSSLLKESAPTNISSLQSNTKSYKSSSQHVK
ncbi:hypothetical protein LY90DRAFT_704320, partial [Neocallimastix californiae]